MMQRSSTGYYDESVAGGEVVRAFVPAPLPPVPALDLQGNRQKLLEKALAVLGVLRERPLCSLKEMANRSQLSVPTVTKAVLALVEAGLVHELTGQRRNRVFAYTAYLAVLNEEKILVAGDLGEGDDE